MDEEMQQFYQIMTNFRKFHSYQFMSEISNGDFSVLKMISHCEKGGSDKEQGVKVSNVVRCMECAPPMVSRSLRKLEEEGYIIRSIDRKDRRNTLIQMTPEGRQILHRMDQLMVDFAESVFRKMGAEKVQEFIDNLIRFQTIIREEIGIREQKKREKGE